MNPRSIAMILTISIAIIAMALPQDLNAQTQQYNPQDYQPQHNIAQQQLDSAIVVNTPSIEISYQIENIDSATLDRVEIWYATEIGQYQLYGYDSDMVSPVSFVAPGEGIYRLLIIAVDRYEQRSEGITPMRSSNGSFIPYNTSPHITLLVDSFRPQLFLSSPRENYADYAQRSIRIEWVGSDTHVTANPVQLFYQQPGEQFWTPISHPMPAAGGFTWDFPSGLTGQTIIKAVMVDRAGNSNTSYSGWINITSLGQAAAQAATVQQQVSQPVQQQFNQPQRDVNSQQQYILSPPSDALTQTQPTTQQPNTVTTSRAPQAHNISQTYTSPAPGILPNPQNYDSQAAAQFLNQGQMHAQRFEWPEAISAFQQALAKDQTNLEARIQLANAYFQVGQYQQTQHECEVILQLEPNMTSIMRQLARAQQADRQYGRAQQTLDRLLEIKPDDYLAWLMRGNIAEQQGSITLALDSWKVAANGAAQSQPSVAQMAQERISRYEP